MHEKPEIKIRKHTKNHDELRSKIYPLKMSIETRAAVYMMRR